MTHWTTHWHFKTPNFRVEFAATPEEMHPTDSFEFAEDIEAVLSGKVDWFIARVTVYGPNGEELAADYLGGCAYSDVKEFYQSHRDRNPMNRNSSIMRAAQGENTVICHYFPSMVAEAVKKARKAMLVAQSIRVRT